MHPGLPAPLQRRGPRPLLLHLTLAALQSMSFSDASVTSNAAWQSLNIVRLAILRAMRETAGGEAHEFPGVQVNAAQRHSAQFVHGVAAYRRHGYRRELPDPPVIWREGCSRLLDYGGTGPSVMFVPSLINRAYVLDLMQGLSMMRWLAERGVRPLLLDWGWPEAAERSFTMTDYVAGRLERGLINAVSVTGHPVTLAGYCMGGTLAVAAAHRRPDLIKALVLLAAPWDFHAPEPACAVWARQSLAMLDPVLQAAGTLPVDYLQALFTLIEPWSVSAKYRTFAEVDPDSDRARLFVALEDWLNDGVPLAAPVARSCLADWYADNLPLRGGWRIAGLEVDPTAIDLPAFVAVPSKDRIVPPESSLALAKMLRRAMVHQPKAGHIGMAAGPRAEAMLWQPLLVWLQDVVGPR